MLSKNEYEAIATIKVKYIKEELRKNVKAKC